MSTAISDLSVKAASTNAPSASRRWLRAIELTARIDAEPERLLADIIFDRARLEPDRPALISDTQTFTYGDLADQVRRYARLGLRSGVKKGSRIALVMSARPEYVAAWAGMSLVGGVVALINTQLRGASLAHALKVADARYVIVDASMAEDVKAALGEAEGLHIWVHGADRDDDLELLLAGLPAGPIEASERRPIKLSDSALLIYTSGTTGFPKAAFVSHHRVLSWGYWFAGLSNASPEDRLYNCLPVYHSVGGVVAISSMLAAGGSVVLVEKFSARRFWSDVVRFDCTMFQYIGELCRYLVKAPACDDERRHRLRLACGNGLRADVWEPFKARFAIPQILEFYAATEGNFSLFNVEGKPGSIGRIPPFLKHRFPAEIVRFDPETNAPLRGSDGLCVKARDNEVGEALGRISSGHGGGRFEGYTNSEESERKILRNVFAEGDMWFRTGDLMRIDKLGFYYFVDRVGDTFRWKGENVATAEVSAAIAEVPGIVDVSVYGVAVPGADGRAGMAAIVTEPGFDAGVLRQHLRDVLPVYARPVFLRLTSKLALTETFKLKRQDLVSDGFDLARIEDAILIDDAEGGAYVPLTVERHRDIMEGRARL